MKPTAEVPMPHIDAVLKALERTYPGSFKGAFFVDRVGRHRADKRWRWGEATILLLIRNDIADCLDEQSGIVDLRQLSSLLVAQRSDLQDLARELLLA